MKVANDGEKALSIIKSETLDLILLDLMIPGMDGISLNRQLKMDPKLEAIPVIMLTAKSDETDVIVGLEMGAEDYITKPFSHKVVLARIKHVLKRKKVSVKKQSMIHYKTLTVNTNEHEVRLENKIIDLTKSEFDCIQFLAESPGWVFSRFQIIQAIKGYDTDITDRTIDVLMVSLRKKLGLFGKNIDTVRGVGYRLKKEND